MLNIIIIICVLSLVLSIFFEKNIYNPVFIFSAIWTFIFVLYKINPYDLPMAEESTLLCFLVGIGSFVFGAFFLGNIRVYEHKIYWVKTNARYQIEQYINDFNNEQLIFILQIVGAAVYLYLGLAGLKAILSGNTLMYVRYYLRLTTLETGINGVLISYVAAPIMYFSITYSAANIGIHNVNKRVIRSTILSLIMLIMDLLTVGGRMGIMYTIVAVFVCYFIYIKHDKQMNVRSKARFAFFIVILFGIYFMWSMAASRGGTALKDTIVYFYAPISCFDRYRTTFLGQGYQYTLGLLSSQGFTRPVLKLLGLSNILLVQNVDKAYDLIDSELWLNSERFNSETTFVGYFFFDGGIITVCIFSMLFGYICQKYYKNSIQKSSMRVSSLCIYIMMLGTIALSFIQFSFAAVGFALSLVWLIILKARKYTIGK